MRPDVVVDVGNTRIKFGLCDEDRIPAVAGRPHAVSGPRSSPAAAGSWAA